MNRELLKLEDVTAGYRKATVLRELSFEVQQGQCTSVIGANGAGKTTMLRAVAGLIPVRHGRLAYDGTDLHLLSTRTRGRLGVSFVPEGQVVFPAMSVRDNLLIGSVALGKNCTNADLERIYTLFPVLARRQGQNAGTLSGGEQRMLAIGRALTTNPRLLLLDEPSSGLAHSVVGELVKTIIQLVADGVTILLVEQNLRLVEGVAGPAIVMSAGRQIWQGNGADAASNDIVTSALVGKSEDR